MGQDDEVAALPLGRRHVAAATSTGDRRSAGDAHGGTRSSNRACSAESAADSGSSCLCMLPHKLASLPNGLYWRPMTGVSEPGPNTPPRATQAASGARNSLAKGIRPVCAICVEIDIKADLSVVPSDC
jgi:hypothetical protein